ncbi:MAG: cyclic nucleotide-binding domain-containing protein [Acidimicrobiia bacterium]|nr:cyclic nucleotide-binding domain-containing protein [Acidimicrobiia bacterium]
MSVLHREDQKIARLKSVGLFAGADDTALRHLASAADEVHVAAGTVIISEGHHHSEGYIIAEGTASVLIDGEEVAEIGVNEVFGELGLFGGHPTASATVAAKTDVAAFVIPYNLFDQVLDDNPQLLKAIVRQLAERLRATDVLYHDH